jgi:hypothetical protein
MKTKHIRTAIALLCLLGLLLSLALPASAVPVFARKYGFECIMCHSNFPRLNDFGQRYRSNGYQLPGRENEEKTILESPTPLALRTSAGYNYDVLTNYGGSDTREFQINGLDLLSAGLLYRNIGYMLVYPPHIEASRGVVGQGGTIEMANIMFSHLFKSTWLNLRVGRFEPAYVPFSVKRSLTASPYEIYDYSGLWAGSGLAFSETQEGIELTGYRRCGFAYALGIVNGSPANPSDKTIADGYGRLSKVFGAGEGQTAGQRVGLTGYYGKSYPAIMVIPTDTDFDDELVPLGGTFPDQTAQAVYPRYAFYRLGADASLNYKWLNLALQYLYANDSGKLWGLDSDTDVSFWGGFAELSVLPHTCCVGFARFDYINAPGVSDHNIDRITVGARCYPLGNLAVHLEYSRRTMKMGDDLDDLIEDFATVRLDFAF